MTTTTQERDDALVPVSGAGLISWKVLRWLRGAERFGVRFHVVGGRLEHEPGDFACIGGLPPPAVEFLARHADDVRRVVLATPSRLM